MLGGVPQSRRAGRCSPAAHTTRNEVPIARAADVPCQVSLAISSTCGQLGLRPRFTGPVRVLVISGKVDTMRPPCDGWHAKDHAPISIQPVRSETNEMWEGLL
jgi:hypothetical protein